MSQLSQIRASTQAAPTSEASGPTQGPDAAGNEQAQSQVQSVDEGMQTPFLQQAAADLDTPPPTVSLPVDELDLALEQAQSQAPAKPQDNTSGSKDDKPVDTAKVTGIGTKVAIGRFVTAAKGVETEWGTLTPENRAKKMGDAANTELKTVSVPEAGVALKDLGASTNGEFSFTTWGLDLGKPAFSKPSVTKDEAAGMADTVYHESRHCEQWFRMARLVAGEGKDADTISKKLFIPKRIAEEAVKQKFAADASGQDVDEAKEWHKSVYGTGSAERNKVLKALGTLATAQTAALATTAAAEKAYKAAEADTSSTAEQKAALLQAWKDAYAAWQEAKRKRDENYQKYRDLSEEKDAWAVGGAVRAAYKA